MVKKYLEPISNKESANAVDHKQALSQFSIYHNMQINIPSLKNHFLIAMPQLSDPNFAQSITYICDHNSEGTLGIIVNRPLGINLTEIMSHMGFSDIATEFCNKIPVYSGGPVQCERGFILHRNNFDHWSATMTINDELRLTTSKDILEAIAVNEGPKEYLIALGYAGWNKGQLEEEIAANAWLSCAADSNVIFNTPVEQRWHAAAKGIGVDLNLLSTAVGHA